MAIVQRWVYEVVGYLIMGRSCMTYDVQRFTSMDHARNYQAVMASRIRADQGMFSQYVIAIYSRQHSVYPTAVHFIDHTDRLMPIKIARSLSRQYAPYVRVSSREHSIYRAYDDLSDSHYPAYGSAMRRKTFNEVTRNRFMIAIFGDHARNARLVPMRVTILLPSGKGLRKPESYHGVIGAMEETRYIAH